MLGCLEFGAVRGEAPAACAVNVSDAGFPACVIVRLFEAPSASVAVAVIVAIATPSDPDAVAGAVIAGVALTFAMVRTVVVLAVALRAEERRVGEQSRSRRSAY